MISVIIVTYNQQDSIGRAIDSVLMQQCSEPVEVVVADDASVDDTPNVCREYACRYPDKVRFIRNEQNKGLVDNYYDTLLECRGDLIADCAGDDCWCDPMKLQKELQIMRQHPDVTLVHTAWLNRTADGRLYAPQRCMFTAPFTEGKTMLEAIITQTSCPVVHLCTAMYRKNIFLKEYDAHRELFRNKELACEDVQIVFAMALHGTIAYLPDTTLHYSVADGSVSNSGYDYERQFRFVRRVAALNKRMSEIYGIETEKTQRYFSLRLYELLMHSFRVHSRELRDEACLCQKEWGAKDTWRTHLLKLITASDWAWSMCLNIRWLLLKWPRKQSMYSILCFILAFYLE